MIHDIHASHDTGKCVSTKRVDSDSLPAARADKPAVFALTFFVCLWIAGSEMKVVFVW